MPATWTSLRRRSSIPHGAPHGVSGVYLDTSAVLRAVVAVWELDRAVCELARVVAPATNLQTLDAPHLATFQLARRRLEGLETLTVDERIQSAAGSVGAPWSMPSLRSKSGG